MQKHLKESPSVEDIVEIIKWGNKVKEHIVAEKIDELVMRKIPQFVRAESASFICASLFVSRLPVSLRNSSPS